MTKQIKNLLLAILLSNGLEAGGRYVLVDIGPQRLESGKTVSIHIETRTVGKLNGDSSNVIIMPTAFGQTTADIVRLTGEGKLADSTRFFVVLLGALGNGISTSPSNSSPEDSPDFPPFTIKDMVNAQKELVVNHLGFSSVYAVIGGSMGGMQALEWVSLYPEMMDKAVIYVSTPKQSMPDILNLSAASELIRNGWKSGQSDNDIGRTVALLSAIFARTPGYWEREVDPEEADSAIHKIQSGFLKRFNSFDYYSQLQAALSHDITDRYNNSLEKAAYSIKAELLIIVSNQDHSVNPAASLDLAKMTGAELLVLDNDCGHYGPSCEKPLFYRTINAFLKR